MSEGPGRFLPYGRHEIDEEDIAAVCAVLRSDSLTGGPVVEEFERAFAAKVGAKFAVACASGTAGLHLAAMAIHLGPGDAAIVPTLTFLATANAPRYVGAEVIFSDVDPLTGLMRPQDLEEAFSRQSSFKARAVLPVHLNGQPVDMESVWAFAQARGLYVIEDACHAIGASYRTKQGEEVRVGSCRHSHIAVFSLHPVKTIAMGEGGVVTTNDEAMYRRLLRLRNHGMIRDPKDFLQPAEALDANGHPNPWYYEMHEPGYNYRASELHCALGLSQLKKLDRFLERRRQIADLYDEGLRSLAPIVRPIPRVPNSSSGWHLYVAKIDFDKAAVTRADLIHGLRSEGIGTQVHYLPVHRQPYYRDACLTPALGGADAYYSNSLSLPFFPTLGDADVRRVTKALARALLDMMK